MLLAADPSLARLRAIGGWTTGQRSKALGWPFLRVEGSGLQANAHSGDEFEVYATRRPPRRGGDRAKRARATRLPSRWLPAGVAGFDVRQASEGELRTQTLILKPDGPGHALRRFSARSKTNCPRAEIQCGCCSRPPGEITEKPA